MTLKIAAMVSSGGGFGGFGGGGFGGFHIGLGGLLILLVLSLVFHRNFFALLGVGGGGAAPTAVFVLIPIAMPKSSPKCSSLPLS